MITFKSILLTPSALAAYCSRFSLLSSKYSAAFLLFTVESLPYANQHTSTIDYFHVEPVYIFRMYYQCLSGHATGTPLKMDALLRTTITDHILIVVTRSLSWNLISSEVWGAGNDELVFISLCNILSFSRIAKYLQPSSFGSSILFSFWNYMPL